MVNGTQQPDFDAIKQVNPYGQEYWSARELAPLLGYARSWENFKHAIEKAMISCEEGGNRVTSLFYIHAFVILCSIVNGLFFMAIRRNMYIFGMV